MKLPIVPINMFLDLETIPSGEREPVEYPEMPTYEDVKTGNRKGETAEAYRKENYPKLVEQHNLKCSELDLKNEQKFRDRALRSLDASIICLGYAFDDSIPNVITGTEGHIIKTFESLLAQFGDKRYSIRFIGHNIKEFDLKLIFHRAIRYDQKMLVNHLRVMGKDAVYDTMQEWGFLSYREMVSQDSLLKYLGLGEKGEIDGSKVYDLYMAGELDRIYEYCKKDIIDVRNIFKAMQP